MLFLLPNLLEESLSHELFLPSAIGETVRQLDGLIAESERGGRRYLRRFDVTLPIELLNEHTQTARLRDLLQPLLKKERWGLISDAGLPCIADPGAALVLLAHELGIEVRAFAGPSSIFLALMLSGLPGQSFAFHGYLPKDKKERQEMLRQLEKRSIKERATQIFMETPYRSQKCLEELIETLSGHTLLSVAWDLTAPSQGVLTKTIEKWKKGAPPVLKDKPALFLFGQNS